MGHGMKRTGDEVIRKKKSVGTVTQVYKGQ